MATNADDLARLAAKFKKWSRQKTPDLEGGANATVFHNLLALIREETRPLIAALKAARKARWAEKLEGLCDKLGEPALKGFRDQMNRIIQQQRDISYGDILSGKPVVGTGSDTGPVYDCFCDCVDQTQELVRALKEIEDDLRPGTNTLTGFVSVAQLAEHYGIRDKEGLRKALERHRAKLKLDADLFVETKERGKNQPQFLYNHERVASMVEGFAKRGLSDRRLTKKE